MHHHLFQMIGLFQSIAAGVDRSAEQLVELVFELGDIDTILRPLRSGDAGLNFG